MSACIKFYFFFITVIYVLCLCFMSRSHMLQLIAFLVVSGRFLFKMWIILKNILITLWFKVILLFFL